MFGKVSRLLNGSQCFEDIVFNKEGDCIGRGNDANAVSRQTEIFLQDTFLKGIEFLVRELHKNPFSYIVERKRV